MQAQVVFVLGGPGVGKGTQCANIVKDYGFVHLSAGDLLREERARGTKNADLINSYIVEGKIVPVEITVALIREAMEKAISAADSKSRFLVDGFPRNEDNLTGWNKIMEGYAKVEFVLFLDCDIKIMIERCLSRAAACADAASVRTDDNVESVRKRLVTYRESTQPIIDLFAGKGMVKKIDAEPKVEDVYAGIKVIFDAHFQ